MSGSGQSNRPTADPSRAAGAPEVASRGPVWARSQEGRRRSTLTREAIVEAAIALADAEGLGAVSIRRVAAELGARTMSLYSHIESKDDLLDLMADEVNGEVLVPGELPRDWRPAITMIAQRTRDSLLRHPWMVEVAGRRPRIGPNGLRHAEQSLAALGSLGLPPRSAMRVCVAVDDYMLGHVIREVMAGAARRSDGGGGEAGPRLAMRPYFQRMVDSGEFRNLAPLLEEGMPQLEKTFEQGLEWLLDGIARTYPPAPDTGG